MEKNINRELSKLADKSREIAFKEYDVSLDYSFNSLNKLERIIKLESQKYSEGNINSIDKSSRIWGVYLGELLRIKYSGDWSVESTKVELSLSGNIISPIPYIKNRFLGSTELSINEYHQKIYKRLNSFKSKKDKGFEEKEGKEKRGEPISGSARNIFLSGSALLIIGGLLPWAKVTTAFGTISVSGYEGDGLISGGIGVLLLISGLLSKGKINNPYSIAGAIFGGIAGMAVVPKLFSIGNITSDFTFTSVGIGIYVSILGVILVIVGGLKKV